MNMFAINLSPSTFRPTYKTTTNMHLENAQASECVENRAPFIKVHHSENTFFDFSAFSTRTSSSLLADL